MSTWMTLRCRSRCVAASSHALHTALSVRLMVKLLATSLLALASSSGNVQGAGHSAATGAAKGRAPATSIAPRTASWHIGRRNTPKRLERVYSCGTKGKHHLVERLSSLTVTAWMASLPPTQFTPSSQRGVTTFATGSGSTTRTRLRLGRTALFCTLTHPAPLLVQAASTQLTVQQPAWSPLWTSPSLTRSCSSTSSRQGR